MTGSDHDANGLSIELPRTQGRQQSNAEDDRIQEVTITAGPCQLDVSAS